MANPKDRDNADTQRSKASKQKLQESEFVAKLVPNPAQLTSTTVLVGFLGRDTQEGNWRLYFTPNLDEYAVLSEQYIVHSESLSPQQSSLGAVRLWIQSNAPLRYTRVTSRQIQAEFLRGSIMSGFTPSATGLPAAILARLRSSRRPTPTDPGSTCEDVCVGTHQACGLTDGCGGGGATDFCGGGGGNFSDECPSAGVCSGGYCR